MHCLGKLVTLVPNFPGETFVHGLSVIGLLARVRTAGFFLFLLWARVSVVLGREAVLAHMNSPTVASASAILAVVGIADLPPVRCGGVYKAGSRICSQAALSGFALSATLRCWALLAAFAALPLAITSSLVG